MKNEVLARLGGWIVAASLPVPCLAADWNLAEEQPVWPLCGRIAKNPPRGWREGKGCPAARAGDPAHSDFPLASVYGPRQLPAEGFRYDWHRAVDIATGCGTPVFAVAEGTVRIAGEHSGYRDLLVQLRHARGSSCAGGCYHTNYMHLSGVSVVEGEVVGRGDLIGWTGYSNIGKDGSLRVADKCSAPHVDFEHLHFEVREAPTADATSAWLRDAINPLSVLPYEDNGAGGIALTIDEVDATDPGNPLVTVTAVLEASARELDLGELEVRVYEKVEGSLVRIPQPGDEPDAGGYHYHPSRINFEELNAEYTHKDSSAVPWTSFDNCPFGDEHPATYDANIHLDAASASDPTQGSFNGLRLTPARFHNTSNVWELSVSFRQLVGASSTAALCLEVWARDVRGNEASPVRWNCSP